VLYVWVQAAAGAAKLFLLPALLRVGIPILSVKLLLQVLAD
jgi:hypothetical protein